MNLISHDRRRRRPLARASAAATVLLMIYLSALNFSAVRSSSRVSRSNSQLLDEMKKEQFRTNQEIQDQRDVAELRLRELESRNDTYRLAIVALERQIRAMGGEPIVDADDIPAAPPRGLERGQDRRDESAPRGGGGRSPAPSSPSPTRPAPTSPPPRTTSPTPSASPSTCVLSVCLPTAIPTLRPVAQRSSVAMPHAAPIAPEDMQLVSVLLGLVLPVVVALATKQLASSRVKAVALAALTTLSAVLVEVQSAGAFSTRAALLTGVTTFVTAVATHYGLLRPAGVTGSKGVVARKTRNVGVGRPAHKRRKASKD